MIERPSGRVTTAKLSSEGRQIVCYTCGCKLPYEDHGDSANLVEDDLKLAGQTSKIDGAGVAVAKRNMLELIQLQEDEGDLEDPKPDYN